MVRPALTLALAVAFAAPAAAAAPAQAAQLAQTRPAAAALVAHAVSPQAASGVDRRCQRPGKVLCVSKRERKLRLMRDGQVLRTVPVQTGRQSAPTDSGVFRVQYKNRKLWSRKYNAPMPWSVCYNGGECFHFSAAFGRPPGSHGCVRIGSMRTAEQVYRWAPLGTRVVVY